MMERRTFIGVLTEGSSLWLVFSCAGILLCTTKTARSD